MKDRSPRPRRKATMRPKIDGTSFGSRHRGGTVFDHDILISPHV